MRSPAAALLACAAGTAASFLAAGGAFWAAAGTPAPNALALWLTVLLALFAHERRGRVENAIALQSVTDQLDAVLA